MAYCNSMITSYVSSGDVNSAIELFQDMPVMNLISWSIMINGHARFGKPLNALHLFAWMLKENIKAR